MKKFKDIFNKIRVWYLTPFLIGALIIYLIIDIVKGTFSIQSIPLVIICMGAIFNFLVISQNNMKMPVKIFSALKDDQSKVISPVHFFYKSKRQVKFSSLADNYGLLFMRAKKRKVKVTMIQYSIGDVLIFMGVLLSLITA